MSILSALTSISNPMKSSKSSVANGGGRLSMGSNSVACGSCGGGSSSSGTINNADGSKTTYYTYTSPIYTYNYSYSYSSSGSSSSCGCH
ncbi:hssA/2C/7E family protein [Dictyostelium discoideum AX4]|uniref:HssA/B-like protein 9 n=1 Tax=Dictyostelium discoideum TaxID=44689 RepID=HSL9_DICDI|nr:hssA/2C/7E family protein [Dictyostelium discoideum AX4]Q55FC2.2 RecName: Full=HssA/B-like protein 9 [Dictyostelium discoideum]EAL73682.2 hssA/2C/7E family protein [Dictyostelium discoideum AX4]|eukprot:XP_647611.2 hssA/2C/7E family protein [Dictyostelium discoideum AX4]